MVNRVACIGIEISFDFRSFWILVLRAISLIEIELRHTRVFYFQSTSGLLGGCNEGSKNCSYKDVDDEESHFVYTERSSQL